MNPTPSNVFPVVVLRPVFAMGAAPYGMVVAVSATGPVSGDRAPAHIKQHR